MNGFQNFSSGVVHSSSPRETASSSSSMEAVNPYSTYLWKWSVRNRLTILPMSVGMNRRASISTYSRSCNVEMIVAYVEGRPMPYSSSALTSDASEYLGGGSVKCCSARRVMSDTMSPSFM